MFCLRSITTGVPSSQVVASLVDAAVTGSLTLSNLTAGANGAAAAADAVARGLESALSQVLGVDSYRTHVTYDTAPPSSAAPPPPPPPGGNGQGVAGGGAGDALAITFYYTVVGFGEGPAGYSQAGQAAGVLAQTLAGATNRSSTPPPSSSSSPGSGGSTTGGAGADPAALVRIFEAEVRKRRPPRGRRPLRTASRHHRATVNSQAAAV